MKGISKGTIQIAIGGAALAVGLAICIFLSMRFAGRKPEGTLKPVEMVNDFTSFTEDLSASPAEPKAGQPAKLTVSIKDGSGKIVKDFDIVHTKPMHLVVVSDDLSYFDHIHPQPDGDGNYSVEESFPFGGTFRTYLDYTPTGGGNQIGRADVTVSGPPHTAIPLQVDKKLDKQFGNIRVKMSADKPFMTDTATLVVFEVSDPKTGQPITDLEPYLGAWAHLVIISQDNKQFLHAHPLEMAPTLADGITPDPNSRGGPKVTTRLVFPQPGLYKVWAQFQRKGQVIPAEFVINVATADLSQQAAYAQPSDDDGVQEVEVVVNANGFDPAVVKFKAGSPARIVFTRADDNNCANEIVFRDLKIRESLPVGVPVSVGFMPRKSGKYVFTCGMNMLRGTLQIGD